MGVNYTGELSHLEVDEIVDNLKNLSGDLDRLLPEGARWKGKGEEYLKELLNRAKWSMFDYADTENVKVELENEEYFINADGSKDYNRRISGSYKKRRQPARVQDNKKMITGDWQRENNVPRGKDRNKPLEIKLDMQYDRSKPISERMSEVDEEFLTPAEFLGQVVNDKELNLKERIRAAESAAQFFDPKLSSVDHNNNSEQQAPFNIFLNMEGNTNTPQVVTNVQELTNGPNTDILDNNNNINSLDNNPREEVDSIVNGEVKDSK